jgi:hypothetical protein
MHQQVAGHLEQEITQKEDAGAEAVNRVAEAQIAGHGQLRETHVHPVEIGRDVAQVQKRNQAPGDFGVQRVFIQGGQG